MNLFKKASPGSYSQFTLATDNTIESLPFYLKEIGYINDRKFSKGNANNYSEYLMLYSLGYLHFTKNTNKLSIAQNEIVVSACNTPLSFVQAHRKKTDYIYIIIGGKHAQLFYNMIRTNNCLYRTNSCSNLLDHFLALLTIDYKSNPLMGQMEAGTIIHQVFFSLYKISLDVLTAKNLFPAQDTAINTAINYIEKNYKNDLDIDTICSSVGFSKYYFCKMFKDHTGVTIHQYVTEYRINQAKNLLSYSKLSITAVANSVGYKSVLTFTRNFERLQHMTPSEYRQYY